ncbi:D(1A) dopamine receptor-like [Clytia hemisphaerica]|uniref:GPCR11 n=1 Tax=Clytia hemisphaerica TaxID=252671 RepID=A0A4P2T0L1_9CNID|nr:GPCR11 [Clytia hemisphaerica]|eukprot:TCONS_00048932-protein
MDSILMYSITILIALFFTSFNILTLLVIASSPTLRKRHSSLPTMSFLVASALQGLIPAPLYVYRKLAAPDNYPGWACDLYRFPYLFCGHIMQMSILLVSLDRMIAIKFPFRYESKSVRKTMILAILVLWIVTLAVDIVPFLNGIRDVKEDCLFNPTRFWGLSVIVFYNMLPFVMVLVNYSIIWCVAVKFASDDRQRQDSIRESNRCSEETAFVKHKTSYGAMKANVTKTLSNLRFYLEIKATKTSLILICVYLICWGPLSAFYILDHFCNGCYSEGNKNKNIRAVIKLINFSSSLLVPLFYCWWNNDYRTTAGNFLKRFCLLSTGNKKVRKNGTKRNTSNATHHTVDTRIEESNFSIS